MRFVGLALRDPVPDATTIWLFREQLARADAVERLFERFDALLRAGGWLAMGGQIADATVIAARRPRLTQAEKQTIKGGGVPAEWKPARRAQIDRDGRWTIKRGGRREAPPGAGHRRQPEIAVPMFGYKNHVSIDRERGLLRRYTVTHAAAYDGGPLGAVLDRDNTASDVWADTAYARPPISTCSSAAGSSRNSSAKSRAVATCRRTSPAAMPPAPGCARASSTSLPPRMPARPGRSHDWPGPRRRQDRADQSRLQSDPAGLAPATNRADLSRQAAKAAKPARRNLPTHRRLPGQPPLHRPVQHQPAPNAG